MYTKSRLAPYTNTLVPSLFKQMLWYKWLNTRWELDLWISRFFEFYFRFLVSPWLSMNGFEELLDVG